MAVIAGEDGQVPVLRDHEGDGVGDGLAKQEGGAVPVAEPGQELLLREGSADIVVAGGAEADAEASAATEREAAVSPAA